VALAAVVVRHEAGVVLSSDDSRGLGVSPVATASAQRTLAGRECLGGLVETVVGVAALGEERPPGVLVADAVDRQVAPRLGQ
jgi:hypothetical protein